MWSVLADSLLDTLKVFPFLFLIYILIEVLEHRTTLVQNRKILQGKLAPLIGSATGIIPQCGFSVMAAKLYDSGLIRTGTIAAVFIATSDEALIIMISNPSAAAYVMPLILIKLIVAVGAGYLINFVYSNEKLTDTGLLADTPAQFCCDEHVKQSDFEIYFVSPLLHTLKIAFYIFIVNFVFGAIFFEVGKDAFASAMMGGKFIEPLITALIGLIPNCASSAILTETFIKGGICFGSLVGGLCSNAGLGLVVLFKNRKRLKRNIILILGLYIVAVATGLAVNGIMTLLNLV
ncbi:MAG: arsenic efflux protein [Clostridiales bacterium]|nr:arsenic efflux protein [Clostridiales bacterium]